MFQSFETRGERGASSERVDRLREGFEPLGIDAFLVPHADEHQSEYLPANAERLAWLSGFTGSAGFALVTRDRAHIFSDGRYTLQLRQQTDPAVWTVHSLPDEPLKAVVGEAGVERLGIDPWLHTIAEVRKLEALLAPSGGAVVRVGRNPIDAIRDDRPSPPPGMVSLHPNEVAGRLARDKLAEAAETLREKGAASHVVTDPLSLAWLFNIRGSDVAHNPVPLGWAILRRDERPLIHLDRDRMELSARSYLTQIADIAPPDRFVEDVREVARAGPVLLDPERAADALCDIVETTGGTVIEATDPALAPRARKNGVEIEGARQAHRRDGAAMVGFLAWLDSQGPGTVTEIGAAEKLEAQRRETGERLGEPLREIAFDTIAGSGPHGAIVHYRVTHETDRTLSDGELFLLDSGGQYRDGTTDITRTVAIGEPTMEMRERFTLVLKGMIAISRLRFPEKIEGRHIDAIARQALWRHGLDYAHGTGHGVGSYGAVHEGPQGISRRSAVALEPGMIVSNEPGYYREGAYGIRIENLVLVHGPREVEGGDLAMLGFETLTLCPIDRRLIEPGLLTEGETGWLDDYHARVERELRDLLFDDGERAWLAKACASLGRASPQTLPPGGEELLGEMAQRHDQRRAAEHDRHESET